MPDLVLQILKYALVAVLYLFLWRVLAAVWSEIRAPKVSEAIAYAGEPEPTGRKGGRWLRSQDAAPEASGSRVHLTAPPEFRGLTFSAGPDTLVGRALDNDIVLDHPTVSSSHCRIYNEGGQLLVEDTGSRNGTYVNRTRIQGPTPLVIADEVGVGPQVTMEVLP